MIVPIVVSVSLYVIIVCFVLYLYVVADPNESPVAYYITKTLPKVSWQLIQRYVPTNVLSIIEFFLDRFMMILYLMVFLLSWSYGFMNIFPWIDNVDQTTLPKYHKYIGTIIFISCIGSWRLAYTSNPGIITSRNISLYNHYSYDNILFEDGLICKTRKIPKLARSKFDRYLYNENIARYDHFCGWVYNTIGEDNYRYFLLFLLTHVIMLGHCSYTLYRLFQGDIESNNLWYVKYFDRELGIEVNPTRWIVFQYLFQSYFIEMALFIICVVMFCALVIFLSYHCYLTSKNITTNESAKWDQVNKWYNRELQIYQEYKKQQEEINESKQQLLLQLQQQHGSAIRNKPTIPDGDVTCVGMRPYDTDTTQIGDLNHTDNNNDDDSNNNNIQHPGPRPINIYDRGFIENWKDVLYPQSLRKLHEVRKRKKTT